MLERLLCAPQRILQQKPNTCVYIAQQRGVPRDVVVKLMRTDDASAVRACEHELEALARLRHPNNVRLLDAGELNDNGLSFMYLLMEYLPGQTLRKILKTQGALGLSRSLHVGQQILRGLAEAHDLDILHRDLKPSNVMLSHYHHQPDHTTLIDYGMAYMQDPTLSSMARSRNTIVGTINYIPPEVLVGGTYTPASDLYNVGLILYECLTGRSPFAESDFRTTAHHHLYTTPVSIQEYAAFPDPLARLLDKVLNKEPYDRLPSAEEFLHRLERISTTLTNNHSSDEHPALARSGTPHSQRLGVHRGASYQAAAPRERASSSPTHAASIHTLWLMDDTLSMPAQLVDQLLRMAGWHTQLISMEESKALLTAIEQGTQSLPDAVAFGVLSTFLEAPLLETLSKRSEVLRILVSENLNDNALTQVINFSGLDLHLRPPLTSGQTADAINTAIARRGYHPNNPLRQRNAHTTLP